MTISSALAQARYSRTAVWLHWTIALLLIANLLLGFFHEDFEKPVRASMMFYHKAIGMAVLALTLVRLAWRLGHRPPAFDPVLRPWEKGLAKITNWLFYALLLAIPMTGWLLSSAGGRVTSFFGLFGIPPLPIAQGEGVKDLFAEMHEILGIATAVLVALHVAGALKHHFSGHKQLMGRMAPWFYRGAGTDRPQDLGGD
jgi:cytochrome b561